MNQIYNTQEIFSTNISKFLLSIFPNMRKTQLKIIPYILLGMILSESFYRTIIKHVIKTYKKKHPDNRVHIIFDHMYFKENYTILMFSFRIGKQGIPLYFRCFKGIREKEAFTDETMVDCINHVCSLFQDTNYELIFLAYEK